MFKKGDKIKIHDKSSSHTPFTTQIYTITDTSGLYIECYTNEYVKDRKEGDKLTFDETDCYLFFDIEEIITNLEKLELRYERQS